MDTIIGGAYKNKPLMPSLTGKISVRVGLKEKVYLNSETVKSYKIVDEGKKGGIGRAAGGALLAGPIGALIGATTGKKKKILIELEWKDGKKSLIECDELMMKAIARECLK